MSCVYSMRPIRSDSGNHMTWNVIFFGWFPVKVIPSTSNVHCVHNRSLLAVVHACWVNGVIILFKLFDDLEHVFCWWRSFFIKIMKLTCLVSNYRLIIIFHMRGLTVIFTSVYVIFFLKNMIFDQFRHFKNLENTKLYHLFSPTLWLDVKFVSNKYM